MLELVSKMAAEPEEVGILKPKEEKNCESEIENVDNSDSDDEEEQQVNRHTERIRAGIAKPDHYMLAMKKLREGNHNLVQRNSVIKKAKTIKYV